MPKVQKAPAVSAVVIALVVVVIAAGGAIVLARPGAGKSPPGPAPVRVPVAAAVATTVPYAPRPGPNNTRILTEPVDPLSLAVPDDWKAPSPDALTLPGELDAFGRQAPSLVPVLKTEAEFAAKNSVRLFAYRPAAPFAFVSVLSYSSPGAPNVTPELVAAAVAVNKKKPSGVSVSGAQLAVGEVLKLDSSPVINKQHLVVELVTFVAAGRTLLVLMVSEVARPGVPPLFGQLSSSLRLG